MVAVGKIKVNFVAVGSAPILKKSKFLMNADDRFAVAISFLRKVLRLSSGTGTAATSSLFLYVNAAFVPSPEERIGDLFDCFGTRGELVVHYSLQEAWG
jgi:ubiquitin-like protein ATG12